MSRVFKAVGTTTYNLEKVLIATACEIAVFGWVSSKKAQQLYTMNDAPHPTSYWVRKYLGDREDSDTQTRIRTMLAESKEKGINLYGFEDEVKEAIEWARVYVDTSSDDSDFFYKLARLARERVVEDRFLGWACALLPTYRRIKKNMNNQSEYIGHIGDDFNEDVVITEIVTNNHNNFCIVKGKVKNTENEVFWYKRNKTDFVLGNTYSLKAKIRQHKVFMGKKETHLTYLKEN